ncbi:MAG: EamA family transporter RarD [Myxococcota bacterium]
MDAAPSDRIHAGLDTRLDPTGVGHALIAYGVWGFAPIYWKVTAAFPSSELLAYRVLASLAVAVLLIGATRGLPDVVRVLRSGRAAAAVVLASLLIAVNWLTFIYAVQTDRIVATSLGYYINPLVNVLFGLVLLRERLTRAQGIAVGLAAAGVAWQAFQLGELPWISLVLATSFGLYGLVRKLAPAAPLAGYALETLTLAPLALLYLAWLGWRGVATVGDAGPGMQAVVAASGLITATPLVAFASAAKRLPLSTLGMFQYIAPTLALGLAVVFYGEPFTASHAVGFGCVWAALALYAWDGWQRTPHTPLADVYPAELAEAPEGES